MSNVATLEAPPAAAAAPAPAPAAPVATPPAQPAPAPSAETFSADAAQATPDALIGLLPAPAPITRAADRAAQPAAQPAAPAPTPATPEPAQPAAAATPAAPATPTPDPAAEPQHAKNWRVQAKDAKEAMVMQLVKQGASLPEAFNEVYGTPQAPTPEPAAPAQPATPQPDPVQQIETQIAAVAGEIANIEAAMEKATADNDLAALTKLSKQFTAKTVELSNKQNLRAQTQQSIQDAEVADRVENHRQLVEQSVATVYELYPDLKDAKSSKRAAFNLKVAALEKNPAFGPRFRQNVPGWPEMVARMVDAEQGWSRAAVPPAPPAVPSAALPATPPMTPQPANPAPATVPLRAPAVELVSPNANPGGTNPTANADTFLRDAANATPDQLLALLANAPVNSRILERARRAGMNRQQAVR